MDDYRARFKSWKCPIKGELTVQRHPWSIEAIKAAQEEMTRQVHKAQWDFYEKQMLEAEEKRRARPSAEITSKRSLLSRLWN